MKPEGAAAKVRVICRMTMPRQLSRRDFISTTAAVLLAAPVAGADPTSVEPEPIIDIHQHTTYSGRTNAQLIAHQKALGVTKTVLLPAGAFYGLDAGCGGNQTVVALAREHPEQFVYFANEVADLPKARQEIGWHLRRGAIGIGEQKFRIACDSAYLRDLARLAEDFRVPILMHFQHAVYNTGIENFHKVLEKFPRVNFIGHAQTWWGNVDKNHVQTSLYPLTRVTPGGITDRLLRDYPNMYGDLSAGSGLNFLIRDEDHTRAFLERHQDKLLFGTDCNDIFGRGPGCQGAQTLAAIRRLAPSKSVERKLLYHNARRVMKV